MNERHEPPEKHEVDERLRQTLGRTREPDLDAMQHRVLAAIREEQAGSAAEVVGIPDPKNHRPGFAIPRAGWAVAACFIALLGLLVAVQTLNTPDTQDMPAVPKTYMIGMLPFAADTSGTEAAPDATEALLMRSDPESILMTNQRHLVMNDPNLRPHTIWVQSTLN